MKLIAIPFCIGLLLSGCAELMVANNVVFHGARNGNGGFSNKAVQGPVCRDKTDAGWRYYSCEKSNIQ